MTLAFARRASSSMSKPEPVKLLVDTCVWLDLAKDFRDQPVVTALADLVREGEVELVVPQIVRHEFDRNKDRVAQEARRSLQSHFRLVRDAVNRFATDDEKDRTISKLKEVDHYIAVTSDAVIDSIERVGELLASAPALPVSDDVKRRVTERALANKAPYHRSKNSVGDAILVEVFADLATEVGDGAAAFVTHNVRDFSETEGDRRKPHPDLAPLFASDSTSYWTSMADFIRSIAPDLLDEHTFEHSYAELPRRLSEIVEAEDLLFRQIWYNRHWNLRIAIENGSTKIVPESEYSRSPYRPDQVLDSVWARALAAAKRTEEEVGLENLGPWTDFEWGMLNGKLSALRWVLGDEWDFLDT